MELTRSGDRLEHFRALGIQQVGAAPIPTIKGLDRDEWPMAMFKEGGGSAHIQHINPSDNRGAGSSIGAALRALGLEDGQKVKFLFV